MVRDKHPISRQERLQLNEKKQQEKRKTSNFKRRVKEAVVEQETEDELRAYVRTIDIHRHGEGLDRDLAPHNTVH